MASGSRTRRLDIEIGSEAKGVGAGFDKAAAEGDAFAKKMKAAGDKAGKGLASGVEGGTKGLNGKLKAAGDKAGDGFASSLESAGSSASSALSSGFDVDGIADMLTEKIGALGEHGGKLGMAFGAIGVAGGAAVAVGMMQGWENEAAGDKLAAQLGLTGKDAEKAGKIAGDLYVQNFGDSIGDTAEAVRLVQGAFGDLTKMSAKDFETLAGQALTFTDVMGQDLPMSVNAAAQMIRTGLARDSTDALNLLTVGIQKGADKAGDLAETMNEYGTQFRQLGLSGADAIGLMTQGVKAGARDADTVADSLKELAIRAQDGSDTTKQGFKAMGLSAKKMGADFAAGGPRARGALDQVLDGLRNIKDPAQRAQVAVSLFGTKAEDLQDAIGALDLSTAAAGLGNYSGAVDGLNSSYDNASSHIETFRREAMAKLTEFIGNSVLPKLQAFGNWAKENPGTFKILAGVVGGVLVAAMVAYTISATSAAIATLGLTWPVVAVIAGIAALAAGLMYAYENFGWFHTAVDTAWQILQAGWSWISSHWPLLLTILTGPIMLAVYPIVHNFGTILAAGQAAWNWVKAHWPLLLEILTGPIGLAVGLIRGDLNGVVSFVKQLPGRLASAAAGMWRWITQGIDEAIARVWAAVHNLQRAWNAIPGHKDVGGGGLHGGQIPTGGGGGGGGGVRHMAEGGIARARPGGILANIAEGGHDEAVVPLDGSHGLGGDTYVTEIHVHGTLIHERDLERTLVTTLNRAQSKGVTLRMAR